MTILNILRRVETCHLKQMLHQRGDWKTVSIDYAQPFVERLYTDIELSGVSYRVCLHVIHQCEGEALFHPHPWPSAVKILKGHYEQITGFVIDGEPQVLGRSELHAGTSYSMTHPAALHSVRPLSPEVWTLMVMGPPYEGEAKKLANTGPLAEGARPAQPLKEMADKWRVNDLFRDFKSLIDPEPGPIPYS